MHRKLLFSLAALILGCSDNGPGGGKDGGTTIGVDGGNMDAGNMPAPGDTGPIVQVLLPGEGIPKYVDSLPTFSGKRASGTKISVDIVEFQQQVLPASVYANLPTPFKAGTFLWGYDVNHSGPRFPATSIEAMRNTATTVTYTNLLQGANSAPPVLQKYLITDQSIHWADPLGTSLKNQCTSGPPLAEPCLLTYAGEIPTTVHLHGAEVASAFDGNPDTWFTPGLSLKGPAYVTNVYQYPNTQEATTLWFHDHALGRVRLHIYAGMAGFYLIRDARDTGLPGNPIGLPAGAFETELAIADRQFDDKGQLFFPNGTPGNPNGLNGPPPNPDYHPYWIPEFFGDVVTVNGKSWPFLEVQPRRYRFRVLDASNARFYRVQLLDTTGSSYPPPNGKTLAPGPAIWQIGSDGGLLNAPVKLDDPADANAPRLFLAPAERADIIIDFGGQAGKTFTLVNDAMAPFPTGNPPDPGTNGQIMQFRVNQPLQGADTSYDPSRPGTMLRAQPIVDIRPTMVRPADKIRQLVLVEVEGPGGPEEVLLNNSHWDGKRVGTTMPVTGSTPTGFGVSATETPQIGATEIWEIANLTMDAHPIHLHLAQFQVLGRQPMVLQAPDGDTTYRADWDAAFPGGTYGGVTYAPGSFIPGFGPPMDYGKPNAAGALGGNLALAPKYLDGPASLPEPNETGWKDTLKMFPKQITRIAVRWAPQDLAVKDAGPGMKDPYTFDPTAPGPGYVWHCHIIDHEDNEMMRPMLLIK